MFGICNNLGLLPEHFFPKDSGRDYALSPYLEVLKEHRNDFTVFSGVSHPDVDGGHPADNCFLTAAPHPGSAGFRNTISLDQYIGERIGHLTRFPSLTLGVNVQQGLRSLSWTGSGVLIPCEEKAADVFARMFLQGTKAETEAQVRKLETGQSILDAVAGQAKDLQRNVGARDRDRLDQYFTSVRDLEQRMQMSREWERKPKPKVSAPVPLDPASPKAYMDKVKLMYDMARLAFETDSTRSISLLLDSVNSPAIEFGDVKTSDGYHNLSHHGKSKEKLAQLKAIDEWHMKLLAGLVHPTQSRARRRRAAARPHDDSLRLEPRQRQHARDHEHADDFRRRRFQARPAPRVRHAAQLSAAEPLRLDAATHGLVRIAGLEPARVTPLPPQSSVSANSTIYAHDKTLRLSALPT